MDKRTLEHFRLRLETQLKELLNGCYGPVAALRDSDPGGPMDEADMACSQRDMAILNTIRYRNHLLIREVRQALQRIEEGDFGTCCECSDEIGLERLKAQPTTLLCIHCKRAEETLRRLDAA